MYKMTYLLYAASVYNVLPVRLLRCEVKITYVPYRASFWRVSCIFLT